MYFTILHLITMNGKNLAVGLVVVAIIAIAVFTLGSKPAEKKQQPLTGGTPTGSMAIKPSGVTMKKSTYKDGVYKASGTYTSPANQETIDVSVTLKNGVVTDATFKGNGVNKTTIKLQEKFSQGFKEQVVGKAIDEIALTVVNGSSLTPKGFMDALEKAKQQALQS